MASPTRALVIGSGVIGLQTTIQLLNRNIHVILRSPKHPLSGPLTGSSTAAQSCSMGSGGKWFPTKCDDKRVSSWAIETLKYLLDFYQTQQEPIVEIVPTINTFHRNPPENPSYSYDQPPAWSKHPQVRFERLTIEQLYARYSNSMWLPESQAMIEAGYEFAWLYYPPIIDTPAMLRHMLSEIHNHPIMKEDQQAYDNSISQNPNIRPIDLDTGKYYCSTQEMIQDAQLHFPDCKYIFNCTGLGCSMDPETVNQTTPDKVTYIDPNMVGGRGVLLYYDRHSLLRRPTSGSSSSGNGTAKMDVSLSIEQGPWGSPTKPAYIIPRGNVIVCGGSYNVNDRNPHMTEEEKRDLERNASILACIDTDQTRPWGNWVGFRPVRLDGSVRVEVELDEESNIHVIHNHGHGGSGWTVFYGAVNEAISLLDAHSK